MKLPKIPNNRNWLWLPVSLAAGLLPFTIPNIVINTLFTIIGIVFGIGFSLFISSSYKNVERDDNKKAMRQNLHNIRDRFVFYFFVSTIFYLLYSLLTRETILNSLEYLAKILQWEQDNVLYRFVNCFHLSTTVLTVLCISLLTFVRSYNNLQKLNEDIEG